jgi:molybdate transport system substrate-binding protein
MNWLNRAAYVLLLALTACAPGPLTTLTVFAAASLQKPFTEIGQAFEQTQPNVSVSFNFAGSQQLAQQLTEGAPADVFASANQKQLQVVAEAGRLIPEAAQVFALNQLVVIVPAENPAQISTVNDLARPNLKIVLAAKEVPVGQYALDFLSRATFTPTYEADVLQNVVSYEESVRGVLSKVALGEADAGVVYTSDVSGAEAEVLQLEIPAALNVVAEYPLAPLADSERPELAAQFVAFVRSTEGQTILQKYGFRAP